MRDQSADAKKHRTRSLQISSARAHRRTKMNTITKRTGLILTLLLASARALHAYICGTYNASVCPDHNDPPICVTCPCPLASGGGGGGGGGSSIVRGDGVGDGGGCSGCGAPGGGMASFWISEPFINLRIEDLPLGSYKPARGAPIEFRLSYRQRGVISEDATIFGVGTNWSWSSRVFLADVTALVPGLMRLHRGGAGAIDCWINTNNFFDGSMLTNVGGTYQIEYPDGRKWIFGKTFLFGGSQPLFFLTAQKDPAGNTVTYNYSSDPSLVQLTSVQDADLNSTLVYYENTSFPAQITKVVDPFGRTNVITYDNLGTLTNITDAVGLSSGFAYDAAHPTWITNMTTPYGSTGFRFGGVNANNTDFFATGDQVNRFVEVTLPSGGKQLYLYRQDCSGFLSSTYSPVPKPSPLSDTLDNVDQQNRNSFFWDGPQYDALNNTFHT